MRKLNFNRFISCCFFLLILSFLSCQQDDGLSAKRIVYSDDIYELKEYKVERHPPVLRNGFGMDMYHEGDASADTMYFASSFSLDTFKYDLRFFNEFTYSKNALGDYAGTGYPVIFMYTDTLDDANSAKACMIGQGVDLFESFSYSDINDYKDKLVSDPYIYLDRLRTELHTETVDGTVMLRNSVKTLYNSLAIGNKFRPNIGGVFEMSSASDETQIDLQPVFLIQTREGLYSKFMVTRFKGTGEDTKKLTLQWRDLRN
jgi:hypothetical protein